MAVRVPSRVYFLPVQWFARILFKEFVAEHRTQHRTAYIVQIFHIDTTVFCRLNHFFIIVSITAIGRNAGSQCLIGCFNLIFCRVMFTGCQISDSATVTDDESIESPFLTQYLLQQFFALGNRNSHIIGIGHHQRLAVIITDRMTERNQMNLAHFTFGQSYIM